MDAVLNITYHREKFIFYVIAHRQTLLVLKKLFQIEISGHNEKQRVKVCTRIRMLPSVPR